MSADVPALPLQVDPLIREAKRRARRRRLVAGAVLLTVGGVVGGVLASGSAGTPGEVPWLPTRPQLGAANPPLAAACTASQLRATLALQGETGSLAGGISIVNRSSRPCALVGRPKLSFAGATSQWRETRWRGATNLAFDPLAPPRGSLRALAPGEHVTVGLAWSNWCGRGSSHDGNSGLGPAALLIHAPGGGTVALRQNRIGGGVRPLGGPACYASPSTLSATSYTPYVPQGPPSSALPLRARIVPGPQLTIKGKRVAEPTLVARRGAWLSYSVVLTNPSGRPFRFGQGCPAYTEGVGSVQNQAYVLNCHAVGSIAAGKSVVFAMRVHVPRHAGSYPPLGWTLAPHSWNPPQTLAILRLR